MQPTLKLCPASDAVTPGVLPSIVAAQADRDSHHLPPESSVGDELHHT